MSTTSIPQRVVYAHPLAGTLIFFRGHSARIVDALLMGFIVVRTSLPGFPLPLPVAQVALIALLAIVAFRRPTRSFERMGWYPLTAVLLLMFLAVVSLSQDVDFTRRLGNIAVLMTVAGFMASGRIDVLSGIKGLGVGLTVNLILFYVGIAPDTYSGGVLTGYLSDKNAAGLAYGLGALLLTLVTRQVWLRVLILLAGFGTLMLTDSRTSIAAYAAASLWLLIGPRLGFFFKLLLGGGIASAFFWADANLSDAGRYADSREGSDALRERIDVAAQAKVDATPWYGGGLGEAVAEVEGDVWFFHNSYLGLWAEGGVVATVVIVGLYCLVGFGFLRRSKPSYSSSLVGGATIFLLLAATRLGEVFLAPIGFVLLGVGLALLVEDDPFVPDPHLHGELRIHA